MMPNPDYFALAHLGDVVMQYIILLTVCSTRLLVVMIVFPPTGDSVMQGVVRNGVALLWSSFIAYGQQALMPELHGVFLIGTLVKEAVIGLMIGYAAATLFWSIESVGSYIDDLTGYIHVLLTNPTNGQQTSMTSTLLLQCVTAAFWLLGGMTSLLGAVYESYHWWPLASTAPMPAQMLEDFVLRETDTMMQMVGKLAAPVMMILLLVDIGFAVVGKAAQKLDIDSLAHPVKGALTVMMLAFLIGVVIDQVHSQIALTGIKSELQSWLVAKP